MPAILPPTFGFVLDVGASMTLGCDRCRMSTVVDPVALAKSFGRDCRIDDAPVACHKCRRIGTLAATGKGNMTMGRLHYWPPSKWYELTVSD